MGFYLMVPGMCVYLALLCLLYYFPVQSALMESLPSDEAIFYTFLFLVFYPISLLLMGLGNKALHVLSLKKCLPLSLLPFLIALALIVFAA